MVLIVTSEPGSIGQAFIPSMLEKVTILRQRYPDLCIQVDGRICEGTARQAIKAGANAIVAGSAILGAEDPQTIIKRLRKVLEEHKVHEEASA
jgi:ribulose-phosphate 3-epimerase